jgi:hypothetical protein
VFLLPGTVPSILAKKSGIALFLPTVNVKLSTVHSFMVESFSREVGNVAEKEAQANGYANVEGRMWLT